MQERYRIYQRGGKSFYAKDTKTGRAFSLNTSDVSEAKRLVMAKNQSTEQPCLNVAMRGVSGVGEELPMIVPLAQTFRSSVAGSGIGYVIKLALENKGATTVTNVRTVVQHTETGCIAGSHDENWWTQEQEAFMAYNPRKLNGHRDIHPDAPAPVLQIPLRSGDSFEVTILLSISATDLPMQWWQVVVDESGLKSGTIVRGTSARPGVMSAKASQICETCSS